MHNLKIVFVIEFVGRKDAEFVTGFEKGDRNPQVIAEVEGVGLGEGKIVCHGRVLHRSGSIPADGSSKGTGTVAITAQTKAERRQLASRPFMG
ncbi:hypothetical protein [Ensifer adhaerens]|uniref:hypothetical protein n=1 Tax=Ensifer adhaerens TaxID=106592 RepID=UPI001AEE88CE|nr:hypothetical protein [Ensifer adhaerens]